jgi:predicted Zn-dependent protease
MKPIQLAAILAIGCALPAFSQTTTQTPPATTSTRAIAPAPADDTPAKDPKAKDTTPAIKPAPAIAPAQTEQGPLPSPGDNLNPNIPQGSEDDVNAIGSREIGRRGMGNWYSTNWEIGVGSEYSQEVLKSSHMITDPVVTEYVNRIGQNIVKNSDAKVPFTIRVIDSDEINAFALPGGFFFVNSGLILAADEESELAGVMAHEISHVIAHHAARQMTRANYAQIGELGSMIFLGGWTGYGIYEGSQIAIPMTFLEFSRTFEAEADYLGVQYMYKAGYDPQGMITMFEKLEALEKQKPGSLAKAFEDHPPTGDRIVNIENEIATILPPKPDYVVTTSEFDDVKARLARIENKRKTNDGKGGNTPTLRRTGGPSDPNSTGGTTTTDQGSDRPTLHPRSD